MKVEGRVYLFLLDDFILERMGPSDLASVALASGAVLQDLTSDPGELLSVVDRFVSTYDPDHDLPFKHVIQDSVRKKVVAHARALAMIQNRQKALVLLSPDAPCFLTINSWGQVQEDGYSMSCGEMFESMVRAGIRMYTIDPRGAFGPTCAAAEFSGETCFGPTVRTAAGRWQTQQSGARTFAEETGGFAASMTNNFDAVFDRLVLENSTYYIIGYYSTNDRLDGRFREHGIRLANPTYKIEHRAGYVAPRSLDLQLAP